MRPFESILRSFPGRLLAWREGESIQDADTGKRPRTVAVTVNEVASGPETAGVYARLAEIGLEPVRFAERLRARMPLAAEVATLDLPSGTPVIAIARTAFDASDRCVEFTEMILDASAYELEFHAKI